VWIIVGGRETSVKGNGARVRDGERTGAETGAQAGAEAGAQGGAETGAQAGAEAGVQAGEQDRAEESSRGALALRALAHPLRWKLIDLLGSEDSATATRCAEALGESVPSCAYHLGILAKYGYIELVPDHAGREKPWRLASYEQVLSGEGLGIEAELAAEAATDAFLDHEFARIKDRWRRRSLETQGWRDASGLLGATFWVTAEELRELTEQLTEIAVRYSDRLHDPGKRPEGARQARVFFSTSVAPQTPAARPTER
jgi:Helix-turn-helix domain